MHKMQYAQNAKCTKCNMHKMQYAQNAVCTKFNISFLYANNIMNAILTVRSCSPSLFGCVVSVFMLSLAITKRR